MNKNTVRTAMNTRLSTQDIAFMAIFAALSAVVIRVLPGIPIIGVAGSNIKFDAVLAPVYGLVIGPYLGFLAALLGGLITAGDWFSILTSFSPAVSALMAGLLTQNSFRNGEGRIKGWMLAACVLGLLILGWYFTDVGRKAPFYPVLHLAGFALIIASRSWTAKVFKNGNLATKNWHVKSSYVLIGIIIMVVAYMFTMPYSSSVWVLPLLSLPMFLIGGVVIVYSLFGLGRSPFILATSIASYCAIIADHMLGNLVFIGSLNVLISLSELEEKVLKPLGLPDVPSLFMYAVPVSAIERTLFTVVAVILGIGLILALRRTNLLTRKL